ncbi:MAG: c-type cytochrome [Cyclobacteriaceae bacterium]|nr:c-type cytochrome [Cyclobacteriaceae bacterium]
MCQKTAIKHPDKNNSTITTAKNAMAPLPCRRNCDDCRKKQQAQEKTLLKKLTALLSMLLLGSVSAFAQDGSTPKTFWDDPFNSPMLPLYAVLTFVLITIVLVLVVVVVMLRVLNVFIEQAAKEKATRLGISYASTPSWWSKLWNQANDLVPLEEEKSIELDHNYDGIKELDNHLPPWWKGLFYGCIVFAVIYMVVYHFTDSFPLPEQEYQNELAAADDAARILKASQPAELIDENTLLYSADAEIISRGKLVFSSSNCASCHRADGGGNSIGPNLTDEFWLHGGDIKNIYHTINNGFVEKAMPAWGKVMSQKDVRDVAFYVMSLQGSKPANPKAPQGERFSPTIELKPDTTRVDSLNIALKK